MKKFYFVVLALIVLAAVIYMPNRLENSLVTREPTHRSEVIVAPTPSGRSLQPQLGEANIDLNHVITLLPPDAIPAILPEDVPGMMVTAAEADAAGIAPTVRVIGLSINGDNRAYPIPFLSAHEIVNDEVGGQLVAVTW